MMPNDTLGRELIQLVQIDQDSCTNVYGSNPCTATAGILDPSIKCYNTFKTCQDPQNYSRGSKTISISKNQSATLDELYSVPSLFNFNVSLPEINIFSRDVNNSELGKFGRCTAMFKDLPFSDNHLDPYVSERGYNPYEQGTFWTKFLARNPYYNGWKFRIYDGWVGQTLAEMNMREYELEKITNPDSNGNVKITAINLMRKLDGNKNIYPPPSNCVLKNDIVQGQTTFDTIGRLTPYTSETGQEKRMLIGGDSNVFTNSTIISETDNGGGEYTYTVGRGAVSPAFLAGTSCENSVRFTNDLRSIVLQLLSIAYDSSEYDATEISLELSNIITKYTSITSVITKPQPIGALIASLELECGFYIWYDDVENQIKLKTIRDEDDPVITINQYDNLIKGKTISKVVSEDRASDLLLRYKAIIDFTDEQNNYQSNLLWLDSDSSSLNQYGSKSTVQINSKWLQFLVSAESTAERFIQTFKDETRTISFEVDVKDDIRMGQVFKLAWRGFVDFYGNDEIINWICTGRTREGDRLKIKAQEFKFNVPEV